MKTNRVLDFIIGGLSIAVLLTAYNIKKEQVRLRKEVIQKRNEAMICGAELLTARANNVELVACMKEENNCDVTMFIGAK